MPAPVPAVAYSVQALLSISVVVAALPLKFTELMNDYKYHDTKDFPLQIAQVEPFLQNIVRSFCNGTFSM